MIVVISGPGGVGKGTLVERLVQRDPQLVVGRSWTTRQRREREPEDAYVFVDRGTFEERIASDGFFEWNDFIGELYGTPKVDVEDDADLVLEIDVNGAAAVRESEPDALLIFIVAPSPDVQAARLRGRGDPEERVAARLAKGAEEEEAAQGFYDHIVVNDDLDEAVSEVASILEARRLHPSPKDSHG